MTNKGNFNQRTALDNTMDVQEALNHVEKRISDTESGRLYVIGLMKWIIDFDKNLTDGNHIFCYIREDINVGFALDRNGNKEKSKKPNFCVLKLKNTDRQFKDLHLDFDLNKKGEVPFREYLDRRLLNTGVFREDRWVLCGHKMDKLGIDNIKNLFLESFKRKGGQ